MSIEEGGGSGPRVADAREHGIGDEVTLAGEMRAQSPRNVDLLEGVPRRAEASAARTTPKYVGALQEPCAALTSSFWECALRQLVLIRPQGLPQLGADGVHHNG